MPNEAPAASPPPQPAIGARFEAVVLPWLDAAWNLARWLARDDADAQDVVQEAMLRALRYFDSFRGGDARVWLLAIVRNTYFTMRTRTPPGHLLEPLDEDVHVLSDEQASPEALTLLAVDVGLLRQALERLPPPWREAIVLRELEECSYKEIAAITGQKIGTVMSRLARARERLKLELTHCVGEASHHDLR
ncbi:sigma-70 family RNA polymerase sigma factor [Rhodanobacter sp. FDAARGOS 1247]|uniref:sigma-70 family RNA polymerase sigma factor n=1 Tax=Rhodanobacter sp. FDAARGOS 1247 TaxID=2778082 RepID=UPI00194E3B16|nr:sigma-70 family RNA polymerase sigma factor [Rhodanobacter sp. FDAARGOS 1247]QRP64953.1 sigma-70 family RNA polymerase sigma factor [Rhodanobacter sp. FDAARGOS 1247]